MAHHILVYDFADRHATTTTATATMEYVRGVTDRIALFLGDRTADLPGVVCEAW